jgi:hypothetical protein
MPCATFESGEIGELVVPGKPVFLVSHQGHFNGIFDKGDGPLEIRVVAAGQVGLFIAEVMSAGGVVTTAAIPDPLPCPPDPGDSTTNSEVRAFRIVSRLRQEVGRSMLFGDPVSGTVSNLKAG